MELGNPLAHPEVYYGPLLNARFAKSFEEHWAGGLQDGATLLRGGARWNEENRTARVQGSILKGQYMQPCVWEGVTREMRLFQNEILGPTVNLCVADSFDEAMALANGTPFGLASALYTEDRYLIARFKREIHAGLSTINGPTTGSEAHVPYGGRGFSGNGTRETGPFVLDAYTQWHAITDETSRGLQKAQMDTDYASTHTYEASHWDKL